MTDHMHAFAERIRPHLEHFWDFYHMNYGDRDLALRHKNGQKADAPLCVGTCVSTSFLLEAIAQVAGFNNIRSVRGVTHHKNPRHPEHTMWSDHAMLLLDDTTLLDLTCEQFPDFPKVSVMDVTDPRILVQTTKRLDVRKACGPIEFTTLLNRPNPVGYMPRAQGYMKKYPDRIEDIKEVISTFLHDHSYQSTQHKY